MSPPGPATWSRRLLEVADFLLPAGCLGCRERLPLAGSRTLVCGPCLARLRPLPAPACERCGFPLGTGVTPRRGCLECDAWPEALTAARSAFLLRPPADALVHALKYGGWPALADPMGRRMAAVELPVLPNSHTLAVPVPTTRARRRRRGYNQAELLARIVATERGIPWVDALERTGRSVTQVALHPTQRRANVENVFSCRPEGAERIGDGRVLLIDDVLTTGATAGAAAGVLIEAGARAVTLLTFARALPFRSDDGDQNRR